MIPLSQDHSRLKIIDFGLGACISGLTTGGTEFNCGTPLYMSPERLSNKYYGAKADIYSAGVILFELLTGKSAVGSNCKSREELKEFFKNYSWESQASQLPE
jgi:serine/threonine protein kinase